jgi:aryl-alcohol dehydrogenase-like predicted oxidoreductase
MEEIAHHRPITPPDHDEFYRRVAEAFRFLEEKVRQGKIRWYGISSNNYPLPASQPTHTSVERTLAAAESVTRDHHFRVVQLPLNLYESGAALERNNAGRTALEFCRDNGIGVLANRPLNAFHDSRLTRLADFLPQGGPAPGRAELEIVLRPLAEHEQKLVREMGGKLMGGGIAASLVELVPQLQSVAHWEQVVGQHVIRPIQGWLAQCRHDLSSRPGWDEWQEEFIRRINDAFKGIDRHLAASQQKVSDEVRVKIAQSGYPPSGESLSRLAVNVLLGLDGLSCVLVGMRRPEYVEDAMGAVEMPRVDSLAILEQFAR